MKVIPNLETFVWLANKEVHEKAKLQPKDFLKRIECVKQLRVDEQSFRFTFYPCEMDELEMNESIFKYVNDYGNNHLNKNNVIFLLGLHKELLRLFESVYLNELQDFISLFIAWKLVIDPESESVFNNQLLPRIFQRAIELRIQYFSEVYLKKIPNDHESVKRFLNKKKTILKNACDSLFRNEIPHRFLTEVLLKTTAYAFFKRDFEAMIITASFSEVDWNNIVVNGESYDLQRAESEHWAFEKWHKQFTQYHKIEL